LGRDSYFGMISELLEAWVLVLLASAVVFEENVHKETPDFKWVSEDKDWFGRDSTNFLFLHTFRATGDVGSISFS
jgi:hypothetical protein